MEDCCEDDVTLIALYDSIVQNYNPYIELSWSAFVLSLPFQAGFNAVRKSSNSFVERLLPYVTLEELVGIHSPSAGSHSYVRSKLLVCAQERHLVVREPGLPVMK